MKVVAPTTIAIALSILHHIEAMRKPFVTSKRLQINNKGRQQVTPPITALDSFESSPISKIRGGHLVSDFADYIAQSSARCWCILILSILIDTGSTTLLKIGRDTSSIIKIFFSYGGFFLSLSGFAFSLATIDVSIAYAVWAALGTALVSAVGILLFGESYELPKIICLMMIVLGVVGLNLLDQH